MGRGVTRRDSARVTPNVKLCMHTMYYVCSSKGLSHFWPYFEPNIKTEMIVVIYMYLKHSTDYIDPKYIWVHGSNSLG